ncbi:MAG: peptidoglycan DD-metalloendopeptidase family protein [Patescibacteria group bacterium]
MVVTVAWQSRVSLGGIDRNSLLYTVISGEEVKEGAMDPSRYAQIEGPGIGGARLAAADFSDSPVMLEEGEGGDILDEESAAAEIVSNGALRAVPEPGTTDTDHASERRRIVTHTIEEGETFESIAQRFGISLNSVLWANDLSARDTLKPGDILTIPPGTGVIHKVKKNETVEGLADYYGIRGVDIAKANELENSSELDIGQVLFMPDGQKPAPKPSAPRIVPRGEIARGEPGPGVDASGADWVWPTSTHHISQGFGRHKGVDLDNHYGPIYATRAGVVAKTIWLGGYGNLAIVDHGDGYTSYYAHMSKFTVDEGQTVAAGDHIGFVGSTGRSTGPHLHFEIRKNGVPTSPLSYF